MTARPHRFNFVFSLGLAAIFLVLFAWFVLHAYEGYQHQRALLELDQRLIQRELDDHREQLQQVQRNLRATEDQLRHLDTALPTLTQAKRAAEERFAARQQERDTQQTTRDERYADAAARLSPLEKRRADLQTQLPDVTFSETGEILRVEGGLFKDVCDFLDGFAGKFINKVLGDKCFKAQKSAADLQKLYQTWERAQETFQAAEVRLSQAREQLQAAQSDLRERAAALEGALADQQEQRRLKEAGARRLQELQQRAEPLKREARAVAERSVWSWVALHDVALAALCLLGGLLAAARACQLSRSQHALQLPSEESAPSGLPAVGEPDVTPTDNGVTLRLGEGERLEVVAAFVKTAQAGQRLRPPAMWGAPLARLVHGRYWLSRIEGAGEEVKLVGDERGAGSFQHITLAAGERVAFRVGAMAAILLPAGAPLQLRTRLDTLRRPSWWRSGLLLPAEITGPATLILYGVHFKAAEGADSYLAEQLVAWDAAATLQLTPRRPTTHLEHLRTATVFDNVIEVPAEARARVQDLRGTGVGRSVLLFILRHVAWGILLVAAVVFAWDLVG